MLEALRSSETSVLTRATHCVTPQKASFFTVQNVLTESSHFCVSLKQEFGIWYIVFIFEKLIVTAVGGWKLHGGEPSGSGAVVFVIIRAVLLPYVILCLAVVQTGG
jgi:hypothetical protein